MMAFPLKGQTFALKLMHLCPRLSTGQVQTRFLMKTTQNLKLLVNVCEEKRIVSKSALICPNDCKRFADLRFSTLERGTNGMSAKLARERSEKGIRSTRIPVYGCLFYLHNAIKSVKPNSKGFGGSVEIWTR